MRYFVSQSFLTTHSIDRDNAAFNSQQFEQSRDSGDLITFFGNNLLTKA